MKRIHYIIVLIVLLLIAGYFFFTNRGTTLSGEYTDFAIKDTASITRIFISDHDGNSALLTRQANNSWKINDRYRARQDGILNILTTINRIRVKEPVPKSTLETIIKTLATRSTKVEIYTNGDKPDKVYYVGYATKTHQGTNMLLEIDGKKSTVPFITHIPGFFGYLSSRFFTEEELWRDRTIFALSPDEVASIKMTYSEKPLRSFEIKKDNDEFVIRHPQDGSTIERINKLALDEYLSRYKGVFFEYIVKPGSEYSIDSILSTVPLHEITVSDLSGNTTSLKTYYKPSDGTVDQATGIPHEHNVDRLYGYIDNKDFVSIQWPTLDKILAYFQDFKEPEIVDK